MVNGMVSNIGLRPMDREFLRVYFQTFDIQAAYREAHPRSKATPESVRVLASRQFRQIKERVDWPALLEASGLGEVRLLEELEKRLNAKSTKFYKDERHDDIEDNTTQMRATELLADLHGKRRAKVEVAHSDAVEENVHIYLPDNGRDRATQ